MITDSQHELLKDIINNTDRPDKITVRLDPVSKTMTVEYDDMDNEWFMEMLELTPNALAQADAACGVSPGAMGSAALVERGGKQ